MISQFCSQWLKVEKVQWFSHVSHVYVLLKIMTGRNQSLVSAVFSTLSGEGRWKDIAGEGALCIRGSLQTQIAFITGNVSVTTNYYSQRQGFLK